MRCKTMKEKWAEVFENVKRFFLITVLTMIGTAIFAFALTFALTLNENQKLKLENQKLREAIEAIQEEEEKNTTTSYTVVIDDKTGKILYTDF